MAIFTGTGRAFCAGEDMKESVARGSGRKRAAPTRRENPYDDGRSTSRSSSAINGYAMGGGFMLVERADLRVAVRGAIFESSEAKRWLLGGYDHGVKGGLPHAVATEMAFAFRFTAERLHEVGFLNRLVEPDELLPDGARDGGASADAAARLPSQHLDDDARHACRASRTSLSSWRHA